MDFSYECTIEPRGFVSTIALWETHNFTLWGFDERWLRVPIGPIWLGLVVDSALYSGIWYGLIFAPGAIRRRNRRLSNHCIRCNYDRAGLNAALVCPECGASNHRLT